MQTGLCNLQEWQVSSGGCGVNQELEKQAFNKEFGIDQADLFPVGNCNASDSAVLKCNWLGWLRCAKAKQAEIDDLKAQLAKAQAGPEGFILVSAEQMSQWGHMANCAEQYGCPECYEARGYTHSLACEINAYFNVSEAQEQNQ